MPASPALAPQETTSMNEHTPPHLGGGIDRRESSDAYYSVILPPKHGYRVIRCRDGLQWILQKSRLRGGEREWTSIRHHRNRDALIRSTQALCPGTEASTLEALPEWC